MKDKNIKTFFKFNNFTSYFVLVVAINIVILFFPLSREFGYEFAIINSILYYFCSSFYFNNLLIKRIVISENRSILIKHLALIIITPIVISVFYGLFSKFCSLSVGIILSIIISIPSLLIGISAAASVDYLFPKFRKLIIVLVGIVILLSPLLEIYLNPQVYFYNPLLVFFPGTIYNEIINIDLKLIFYRILNIVYFSFLLFVIYRAKLNRLKFLLVIFVPIIVFIVFKPSLGFSTTKSYLISRTNNFETKHFKIYSLKKLNAQEKKLLILHHEYYYEKLSDFYRIIKKDKISSFVFTNENEKRIYFGAENADVAKPWLNQIYINYNNYSDNLEHEIAHCFTGDFGVGPFKLSGGYNTLLIEGAAMAASPFQDYNTIDYLAALAYNNDFKINIENLFNTTGFFTNYSGLSYIYSGAFCKYLIDNYGIDKFKRLYQTNDVKSIYKTSLKNLAKNFNGYLKTLNASNPNKAVYYFGRKSLITKQCPRVTAEELQSANKLYIGKKYSEAIQKYQNILSLDQNYSALIGLIRSKIKLNQNNEAISILKKEIINYENSSYVFLLHLYFADLYALTNKKDQADSIYSFIKNQNAHEYYSITADVRKNILYQNSIHNYLMNGDSSSFEILKRTYMPESLLGIVTYGRELNINYSDVKKIVSGYNVSNDYLKSYIMEYMIENLDFEAAIKMGSSSNNPYVIELTNKAEWMAVNLNITN